MSPNKIIKETKEEEFKTPRKVKNQDKNKKEPKHTDTSNKFAALEDIITEDTIKDMRKETEERPKIAPPQTKREKPPTNNHGGTATDAQKSYQNS
ncbi:hypothetical protein JTB14_012862 [Gonioctena quinquepunctata]|nr:hypothetical protein JTB14_012862 [Gonioctena quinquepunctata]